MLLLIALLPILTAQPDRYGLPACQAPNHELVVHEAFTICHDSAHKVPAWTAYELTAAQLQIPATPRPSHFRADHTLQFHGATNTDYTHSGFHRGHLVPARDIANSRETFLLSNAAPQQPSLNLGRWRQLEDAVRRLAVNADALYIITGTLFTSAPEAIGPNHVAVPSHFYKAILAVHGEQKQVFAIILPNAANLRQPLAGFATTVDEIESLTGLDLFPALSETDQAILEQSRTPIPLH
ncbi:MAG: DNA/RNA non-specific endonuclease [Acidobacteria bacterium]|nr:DNA/RNA non-specific endonuclease [Acidobacteriota bacterium]